MKVYELPSPRGVEVVRIEGVGPADCGGIQLGDVIMQIGGTAVASVAELQAALARLEPNTSVPVRLIRHGRDMTLNVVLDLVRSGVRPTATAPPDEHSRAGLQGAERGGRVVSAGVQPYSTAGLAGVRAGQVIVLANGHAISSIAQIAEEVRRVPNGALSLIVDDPQVGRIIINYELQS